MVLWQIPKPITDHWLSVRGSVAPREWALRGMRKAKLSTRSLQGVIEADQVSFVCHLSTLFTLLQHRMHSLTPSGVPRAWGSGSRALLGWEPTSAKG